MRLRFFPAGRTALAALLVATALPAQPEVPPRVLDRMLAVFDGESTGDVEVTARVAPGDDGEPAGVEIELPGWTAGRETRVWVIAPRRRSTI